MKVQMKKLRKVFCLLAAAAVPALTDMHEAMAQLPQGMSVEEEENTEATVTKDTTGLDMVTLEIDSLSDGFLDSLDLNRNIKINDYTMIGIQYGMGLSQVSWNPRMQQTFRFVPYNFGILLITIYPVIITTHESRSTQITCTNSKQSKVFPLQCQVQSQR